MILSPAIRATLKAAWARYLGRHPEILHVIGAGPPWDVEEQPRNITAAIPGLLASLDEMERERAAARDLMKDLWQCVEHAPTCPAGPRDTGNCSCYMADLGPRVDAAIGNAPDEDFVGVAPAVPGAERTVTLAVQGGKVVGELPDLATVDWTAAELDDMAKTAEDKLRYYRGCLSRGNAMAAMQGTATDHEWVDIARVRARELLMARKVPT